MQSVITPTFDEYVAARSGALLRFAYLLSGDRHLAEDLVQEVLVKAHRRWSAIEAANPDAYLKQALVRTHVSWRRRRSSSEVPADRVPESASIDAFEDRQASRDEVWAMLAGLSPTQRAVLVLRYYEDLDDQRIAELVAISPSTVRVHAHRGLRALRETLVDRAREAPDGSHLADAVHQGLTRTGRRRRAAAAGTTAVAVVVALMLAVVVPRLWPSTGVPPAGPTVSVTGSPTVSPPPVPMQTVALPPVPGYPFEFTWVAPPYEQPAVTPSLGWESIKYGAQFDGYEVMISSRPFMPEWASIQTSTTTVHGVPATIRTAPKQTIADADGMMLGPLVQLTWQRDAMWISVISTGALDPDAAQRVAESLAPAATPAVGAGMASVEIPAGWVLDQWVPDSVCAKPNDAPPDEWWGVVSVGICITVTTGEDWASHIPGGQTVDGDPAELNVSELTVHRADGRLVRITRYYGSVPSDEASGLGLTDDLVIAMYRGITFA